MAGGDLATHSKLEGILSQCFSRAIEWSWLSPHIDYSIKTDGYKTFPRTFRIAAMTYLNDVEEHGSGNRDSNRVSEDMNSIEGLDFSVP